MTWTLVTSGKRFNLELAQRQDAEDRDAAVATMTRARRCTAKSMRRSSMGGGHGHQTLPGGHRRLKVVRLGWRDASGASGEWRPQRPRQRRIGGQRAASCALAGARRVPFVSGRAPLAPGGARVWYRRPRPTRPAPATDASRPASPRRARWPRGCAAPVSRRPRPRPTDVPPSSRRRPSPPADRRESDDLARPLAPRAAGRP